MHSGGVLPFIGVLSGLKIQEAPHVNKGSSLITVFFRFFVGVIQPLVAETIKYCNQYLDTYDKDKGCSRLPDVAVQDQRDTLKHNLSTLETGLYAISQQHDETRSILISKFLLQHESNRQD
jgi:hypothetical protein